MKIIKTNIENLEADKKTFYKLTKASGVNVKDTDGVFPVHGFLLYEDENREGEIQKILAILTEDADENLIKLQTISATFIRDFLDVVDIMDGEPFEVVVKHGKTKAGMDFVSCELYCG